MHTNTRHNQIRTRITEAIQEPTKHDKIHLNLIDNDGDTLTPEEVAFEGATVTTSTTTVVLVGDDVGVGVGVGVSVGVGVGD